MPEANEPPDTSSGEDPPPGAAPPPPPGGSIPQPADPVPPLPASGYVPAAPQPVQSSYGNPQGGAPFPPGYGAPPPYIPAGYAAAPGAYPYYTPPRTGMPAWAKVMLGACGGCVVLGVLAVVVLTIVGRQVGPAISNLVPLATFPRYPGSVQTQLAIDGTHTRLAMSTHDSTDTVARYYQAALSQNSWALDNYDPGTPPTFRFHRSDSSHGSGTLVLTTSNGDTVITVQYST